MRIKWGQDMATGLLFILIGFGALIIGWDYPRGIPQRPGTGVLPAILSWCLIGSGALLAFKSVTVSDVPISEIAWKPFFFVTLSVVMFGLLIDDLGLVVTMLIAMTLCAMGSHETRWPEFAAFAAVMVAIGVSMFIWLLGMPVTTWPTKFPTFITAIFR